MALQDTKITDLTEKATSGQDSWLHFVDPTDLNQDPAGSSYKISKINFLKEIAADVIKSAPFLGSIVPTSTPTGTGIAYWLATQNGTYTNFGGVVVNTSSLAVVSRDTAGAFSISQTGLDLTTYAKIVDLAKKADLVAGKNKLNVNDTNKITGKFLNNTGAQSSNASYFISDFIPVLSNTKYTHTGTSLGGAYNAFYDVNKTFISSFQSATTTTPSNCVYIRMSYSTPLTSMLEVGAVGTTYEVYKLILDKSQLDLTEYSKSSDTVLKSKINNTLISTDPTEVAAAPQLKFLNESKVSLVVGKNKFNYQDTGIERGKFINSSGGIGTSSSFSISGYIPATVGQVFVCNKNGGGGAYNAFYDINKVYISSVNTASITAPVNTAYIRYTLSLTSTEDISLSNVQIELGSISTAYVPFVKKIANSDIDFSSYALQSSLDLKLDKEIGKNKLNVNDPNFNNLFWINSSGVVNTNGTNFGLTGFIKINNGQSLKANYPIGNLNAALFDSNGVYLSGTAINSQTITNNTGATAYARFPYYTSGTNYQVNKQIEVGLISTVFEPYTENEPFSSNARRLTTIEDKINSCAIILPSKMYFVKNFFSALYKTNVMYKDDYYGASLNSSIGNNFSKLIAINLPNAVVNQTLTLKSADRNRLVETKTISYDVIDPIINNGKTISISYFGDSFTYLNAYAKKCSALLRSNGINVNEVGTMGNSSIKFEGLGGSQLGSWLTSPMTDGRLVQVTGVTQVPEGRIYYSDQNGVLWEGYGGKVDGSGNGYIRLLKYLTNMTSLPNSGTLTKSQAAGDPLYYYNQGKEGDAVITFSNPIQAASNSYWNYTTNSFDIPAYMSFWGLTAPQIFVIQFTYNDLPVWADASTIDGVVANFKTYADHVRANYPNSKIVMSIEPYCAIEIQGVDRAGKKYAVQEFAKKMFAQFTDNVSYNSFVFIAPSYAFVDLVNGYVKKSDADAGNKTVVPNSKYPTVIEPLSGDGIHPNLDTGMAEIGECIYQVIQHIIKTYF